MESYFARLMERSLSDGQDDTDDDAETQGLLSTLWINLVIFSIFMTFYEMNRHMKSIYLKRLTTKFKKSNRVPPLPGSYPFAWIVTVMRVGEDDLLRMVGLDGYMLIRYINICIKMSFFFTFWGLVVLAPVYGNAQQSNFSWNKYTLANIPNNPSAHQLWVPAIFAYIFSTYFCHLMYNEYRNFVTKRIQYLIEGDGDTPPQTYYTLMIEKVPLSLRSAPALEYFFENLFPDDVHSVEIALDLQELDLMTDQRRKMRDSLEKSIALSKATNKRQTEWIKKDFYQDSVYPVVKCTDNWMAKMFGYIVVDAINHRTHVLAELNSLVTSLQIATFEKRQTIDNEQHTKRKNSFQGKFEGHLSKKMRKVLNLDLTSFLSERRMSRSNSSTSDKNSNYSNNNKNKSINVMRQCTFYHQNNGRKINKNNYYNDENRSASLIRGDLFLPSDDFLDSPIPSPSPSSSSGFHPSPSLSPSLSPTPSSPNCNRNYNNSVNRKMDTNTNTHDYITDLNLDSNPNMNISNISNTNHTINSHPDFGPDFNVNFQKFDYPGNLNPFSSDIMISNDDKNKIDHRSELIENKIESKSANDIVSEIKMRDINSNNGDTNHASNDSNKISNSDSNSNSSYNTCNSNMVLSSGSDKRTMESEIEGEEVKEEKVGKEEREEKVVVEVKIGEIGKVEGKKAEGSRMECYVNKITQCDSNNHDVPFSLSSSSSYASVSTPLSVRFSDTPSFTPSFTTSVCTSPPSMNPIRHSTTTTTIPTDTLPVGFKRAKIESKKCTSVGIRKNIQIGTGRVKEERQDSEIFHTNNTKNIEKNRNNENIEKSLLDGSRSLSSSPENVRTGTGTGTGASSNYSYMNYFQNNFHNFSNFTNIDSANLGPGSGVTSVTHENEFNGNDYNNENGFINRNLGNKNRNNDGDDDCTKSSIKYFFKSVKNFGEFIGYGFVSFGKEGLRTSSLGVRGLLRSILEGVRTVELLTVGACYKTSSTAFVTLKSRVAKSSAHQLFLSHIHYSMIVKSAPNPMDCIWCNIAIPLRQIEIRKTIADCCLIVGAVFWSIVVGFITAIANLESISKELPFLNAYRNTVIYEVLNQYLAVALLLILLSILPFIFDLIARSYEGRKTQSEIQNSIMTRYFYYQLANVFVSVGLGSIASSIHQIIQNPSSILSILGTSLPSLSVYFTNLLIVKTFTAVPLEILRIWPLICVMSVRSCQDKNKCTIRELKRGAFANPPILYGWIYPNLMMVLMIIQTYCCIAPMLVPFGLVFFTFAYLMYKYQLLFVYINRYQSGGYMWYAVFNRSMVALIAGVLTLLGYLGIRETFFSGPFYLLAPLPFCITYFWYKCEDRFKVASMSLSLQSAMDLDRKTAKRTDDSSIPQDSFDSALFRQPSLAEGQLKPKPYRKVRSLSDPFRDLGVQDSTEEKLQEDLCRDPGSFDSVEYVDRVVCGGQYNNRDRDRDRGSKSECGSAHFSTGRMGTEGRRGWTEGSRLSQSRDSVGVSSSQHKSEGYLGTSSSSGSGRDRDRDRVSGRDRDRVFSSPTVEIPKGDASSQIDILDFHARIRYDQRDGGDGDGEGEEEEEEDEEGGYHYNDKRYNPARTRSRSESNGEDDDSENERDVNEILECSAASDGDANDGLQNSTCTIDMFPSKSKYGNNSHSHSHSSGNSYSNSNSYKRGK